MISAKLKNATPEQQILLDQVIASFVPANIQPFFYQGAIAGSEFLTADVNKMYVCFGLDAICVASAADGGTLDLYNEAAVLTYRFQNGSALWNGAAIKISDNPVSGKYFSFNYIANPAARYTYMRIVGYKLTK